jgi:hypothetical protein
MVPPGCRVGLTIGPITNDGPGFHKGFPDLFVNRVIREEPPQIRRLERNKLIIQVLENSLRGENVQEVPGVVGVSMNVKRQDLDRVEADWVATCARRARLGFSPTVL